MKHLIIANRLQELGHETRLNIYKCLIKSAPGGLSVGEIQRQLNIPASTLSHHISRLASVGLIKQQRSGATLKCIPEIENLNEVIQYLQAECCKNTNSKC